jgi:hypothetical protein
LIFAVAASCGAMLGRFLRGNVMPKVKGSQLLSHALIVLRRRFPNAKIIKIQVDDFLIIDLKDTDTDAEIRRRYNTKK